MEIIPYNNLRQASQFKVLHVSLYLIEEDLFPFFGLKFESQYLLK